MAAEVAHDPLGELLGRFGAALAVPPRIESDGEETGLGQPAQDRHVLLLGRRQVRQPQRRRRAGAPGLRLGPHHRDLVDRGPAHLTGTEHRRHHPLLKHPALIESSPHYPA
ncbi:hypothetical protein ACU635_04170 [[Actinomadura] parvosata]|uniref:hypothetical protein n=1 Tax=[Actinomadura] parvosata TaxID=1955412 RepID=UPI00406D4308